MHFIIGTFSLIILADDEIGNSAPRLVKSALLVIGPLHNHHDVYITDDAVVRNISSCLMCLLPE
jgi:hypothetical protein